MPSSADEHPVSGMCRCTGGLLSGGPNTCHCSCRDLTSAATVAADELGHPADSPGRLAAGADTSAEGSITVAEHRAFTDRRRDARHRLAG